ncbi:hypothetical protein [Shewanella benthica]|nr:hypothetical protein [Shewanella benthica]
MGNKIYILKNTQMQKAEAPSNGLASDMPPRMAVSRITQEQLSKSSALTHKDVRNVENVWNIFLPTQHQATLDKRKGFTLLSHGMNLTA